VSEVDDDASWSVEIEWVARRIHNPITRARARIARVRSERSRGERKRTSESRWWDVLDTPGGVGDDLLGGILAVVAIIVLLVAVIWLWPFIWAVLLVLLEFLVLVVAAVLVLVWRTVLRRRWVITATRGSERWTKKVAGYRRARSTVAKLEASLAAGRRPGELGLTRDTRSAAIEDLA
jgi:hypothetical protein